MKNKKKFLIVFVMVIIVLYILIIRETASTNKGERRYWNDVLNSNPYLAEMETFEGFTKDVDINEYLRIALTSNYIEKKEITEEDKEKNPLLYKKAGYKKSIEDINKYFEKVLNKKSDFAYNAVDTYWKEEKYLIIDEEYVYYTEIELDEKIYIAVNQISKNDKYAIDIYEYNVTKYNKKILKLMLKTGKIFRFIKPVNKYTLIGTEFGDLKIQYKLDINDKDTIQEKIDKYDAKISILGENTSIYPQEESLEEPRGDVD